MWKSSPPPVSRKKQISEVPMYLLGSFDRNFARTSTSRNWWSAASAVGCALMFPGFTTFMATLPTRR